jgi:hypothetical protein
MLRAKNAEACSESVERAKRGERCKRLLWAVARVVLSTPLVTMCRCHFRHLCRPLFEPHIPQSSPTGGPLFLVAHKLTLESGGDRLIVPSALTWTLISHLRISQSISSVNKSLLLSLCRLASPRAVYAEDFCGAYSRLPLYIFDFYTLI